MRFARSHLTMTTAVAALMLPVGALAQQAGFAIEVGPAADEYTPVRVGAHVQGPVSEPASSYVRGCQGSIMAEGDGVPFELTAAMAQLNFTAAGDGLRSMVLGTPDGLYRCALADDQGFAASALSNAGAGRYTVWLGADEGALVARVHGCVPGGNYAEEATGRRSGGNIASRIAMRFMKPAIAQLRVPSSFIRPRPCTMWPSDRR